MDDPRFAVFGAGFWSHFQLAAWNELKGVKCLALCNRTVSKAEKMASEFGVPAVYSDPEELLSREKLDFFDIVTDPSTHSKLVQMVAAHKLPVICQKPMTPTLAEAE
jgi:D-apiose dehydrogenase